MMPGPWQLLIILAVVLLLFGGRGKISAIMGDFGKGLRSFKTGLKGEEENASADEVEEIEAEPAPAAEKKPAAKKKAAAKKKPCHAGHWWLGIPRSRLRTDHGGRTEGASEDAAQLYAIFAFHAQDGP